MKHRKTVRKTEVISFRVTEEVAELIRKAVEHSGVKAGDFYNAGVLSLAINVDAYEAGLLGGRGLAIAELSDLILEHIHANGRHSDHLYEMFNKLTGMNATYGSTPVLRGKKK